MVYNKNNFKTWKQRLPLDHNKENKVLALSTVIDSDDQGKQSCSEHNGVRSCLASSGGPLRALIFGDKTNVRLCQLTNTRKTERTPYCEKESAH